MQRWEGPHISEPLTLIGLEGQTTGLSTLGVLILLPVSDAGDGNSSFAPGVGDNGVGKPGYFLPMSVKSERFGLVASDSRRTVRRVPMP